MRQAASLSMATLIPVLLTRNAHNNTLSQFMKRFSFYFLKLCFSKEHMNNQSRNNESNQQTQ